ncbi:MAG TPA: M6 family metalloprotease domain-containing protein [Verrucomicrobiae bacterium]|nr:M6 family metalloprotease domain-containing protein [Verrucomicrobiae bacterium]
MDTCLAAPTLFVTLLLPLAAAEKDSLPDFADYRTAATAIRAEIQPLKESESGATGFLGIEVVSDALGRLVISSVAQDSPAMRSGVRPGDVLAKLDDTRPSSAAHLREYLQRHSPGEIVVLGIQRGAATHEFAAKLGATSQPFKLSDRRAILGINLTQLEDTDGARVNRVRAGMPAANAGMRVGDVLLQIDDTPLSAGSTLTDLLAAREPGERITITYRRGARESRVEALLAADEERDPIVTFSPKKLWKKDTYRLAVIGVGFMDTKPNPRIPLSAWEEFFFSTGVFHDRTNVTGQAVFGSVNDYYREVSSGHFHLEGRVFPWVELDKKRADYSLGTANSRTRTEFFSEALDKLLAREGDDALKSFDGLAVIYAGERFATANRGTLFWPHRGNTTHKNRRWPYIICPEGGARMANISVFCHEFGHILGLPDLYARPENPGSEGVGTWCAMSNQSRNGRPQHPSAWCKEQLGWINPVVIDPAERQKLLLSPIEGTTNECFKVLVRPDASEYLLLENRRRTGFDRSLAGEGLLIWRVLRNRLMLEEAHGVEGPSGPRVFLSAVPYPSRANGSFTPYTTPSSRSQLGGGSPIHISDIRRISDGRIAFQIGYEYE